MARSPYQGTWVQGSRPTVVTAPDALVFINGEADILGCGECRRRFDWNKYITQIQVDLSVDSCPGSASVNMSIPRHSVDEFYSDGNPLLSPMMEIEIFAKGHFLVEGLPQYYPIFWGLITEVSDDYSGGEHTFSINCSDILKWWEVCMMNINPAMVGSGNTQLGRSIFGNVLFGTNPYDIIWSLAQNSFGDIVMGSGSLVSLYKEQSQRSTFSAAFSDLMLYWSRRFQQMRSNLLLYGTKGNAVRGDTLDYEYRNGGKAKPKHFASQTVRRANGGDNATQMVYDPTDPEVVAFRTQFQQAGQVNFFSSEYQTKLEIANAAKAAIGFEFFMDVDGSIVFKPPFYNLDILSNKPVSWIQDIDVIDWNLSESEAEVVTQLQISGSFGGNVDFGMSEDVTPFTSVTDYHLLRQYGWRTQTFNSEFMGSPLLMFYVGMDLLDQYNAKRFRASVSIPLRPELRLGFPVYLAPKDQIWYLNGISHSIQFGGRAQSSLSLTAKRTKFIAPKGIGSIKLTGWRNDTKSKPTPAKPLEKPSDPRPPTKKLAKTGVFAVDVGEAAQLPPSEAPKVPGADNPYAPLVLRHPKTGKIVGYPNVVLAYTRPFIIDEKKMRDVSGRRPKDAPRPGAKVNSALTEAGNQFSDETAKRFQVDKATKSWEGVNANRYSYGLNSAGVYTYLHDQSYNNRGVIQDVIVMPAANIIPANEDEDAKIFKGPSGMIRPVSDERGFEVIGHFRYGRGLALRDGSLVVNEYKKEPGAANDRAIIGTQLALGGSLLATLRAQSAGLTTITTSYPNPAEAIATLGKEDLETAGAIMPGKDEPEFINTEDNFVDTAPLGSPEQKGVPQAGRGNVEASQLSRALTLSEMSVREEFESGQECSCILGRPDLHFINVGFQLESIKSASQDTTSITYGAQGEATDAQAATIEQANAEAEAAKKAAIEAYNAKIERVKSNTFGQEYSQTRLEVEFLVYRKELDQELQEIENQRIAATGAAATDSPLITEAIEAGRPIAGADISLTREQLTSKVEQYLTTLYKALDGVHQEYEKSLRGEVISQFGNEPTDYFGGTTSGLNSFEPPFDTPGRAVGGDPAALAAAGSAAVDGITQQWEDLQNDLAKQQEAGRIRKEIQLLQVELSALLTEKDLTGGDAELDQKISEVQQKIANLEKQLQDVLAG